MTRLALVVPLVLSAVLLVMGVPRMVASVLKAPAHRTVLLAERGKMVETTALARASTYLERAAGWEHSAALLGALGLVRLVQGYEAGRGAPAVAKGPDPIDEAAERLGEALRLSPVRPHPWVHLAYARTLQAADPNELAGLLVQSVRTGPYVAEIAVIRLDLLLRLWRHITPELRLYTLKQVRFVWPQARHRLLRLVRTTPRPELIRLALRRDPEALEQVESAIARRGS